MKIKFIAVLAFALIGVFGYLQQQKVEVCLVQLSDLEALADAESAENCPKTECTTGGCGSSSCTIEQNYPFWGSSESVTAQNGFFACCTKDWLGNITARSYSNGCCKSGHY